MTQERAAWTSAGGRVKAGRVAVLAHGGSGARIRTDVERKRTDPLHAGQALPIRQLRHWHAGLPIWGVETAVGEPASLRWIVETILTPTRVPISKRPSLAGLVRSCVN